jgi:hypothetical protein
MPKPKLALVVALEKEFEQWRVVARPAVLTGDDDVYRYPTTNSWSDKELWKYADLRLESYVGQGYGSEPIPLERENIFWSQDVLYRPYAVLTADYATAMASTLTKIKKGLERIDASAGYLRSGDAAGYIFRVSSVLGIPKVMLRNDAEQRAISGDPYTTVTLDTLAYRLDKAVDRIRENRSINLYA